MRVRKPLAAILFSPIRDKYMFIVESALSSFAVGEVVPATNVSSTTFFC